MIRRAYLCGQWYPGDAKQCRQALEEYRHYKPISKGGWRSIIAPHAGWAYSGNAMGLGYCCLADAQPHCELVVIFGSHRGPSAPNTLYRGEGWETCLGNVLTDHEVVRAIDGDVKLFEEPSQPTRPDNGVEVHLPFIRHFFPKAKIVMLGVAACERAIELGGTIGSVCSALGRDAVFVGSTDLTHYGVDYNYCPKGDGDEALRWVREENDKGFLDRLCELDLCGAISHALDNSSACCPGAAAAALSARITFDKPSLEHMPNLLDHYLSFDIHPSPNFVGYAALSF